MPNREKIREVLLSVANELNPSRSWPVDVEQVARAVGIDLRFALSGSSPTRAHLSVRDRPMILIRTNALAKPFQDNFNRFSIAHEIGHWVIWRRFGLLPARSGEYWQHERLCNEFAANLLIPNDKLREHLQKLRMRGVHPLHFPRNVALSAEVSWQVAARSISALMGCEWWYLRLTSNGPSKLLITCSTVQQNDNYVADRAKIEDDDLASWLRELQVGKIASKPVSFVAGAVRIRTGGASALREQAERATLLLPRQSTEVVDRATAKAQHHVGVAS